MISILIPVFNYDVSNLVTKIDNQISNMAIKAEIIVVDDASTEVYKENHRLNNLANVQYEILKLNYGRSKIRNYLASKAKFDYLLFIDCDAKVVSGLFLANYIDCIKNMVDVACGGLVYNKEEPKNPKLYFRWFYGINREFRNIEKRGKSQYKSFTSFNFLIRKDIFETIRFNENLSTYGHEDTLLGIELGKQKISINHIDNPLLHDGLEETSQFIFKTNQSINNLDYLIQNYKDQDALKDSIKLVRYIHNIKKLGMGWLLNIIFKVFSKLLIKIISSKKTSLFFFDFYKICYYFSI